MPKDKVDWVSVIDSTRPQYIYPGEVAVTGRMTCSRMFTYAIVTCCKQCNYAKRKMTNDEFLSWIKSVHDYQKEWGKVSKIAT